MLKNSIFILIISLFLFSCKKKEEKFVPLPENQNYQTQTMQEIADEINYITEYFVDNDISFNEVKKEIVTTTPPPKTQKEPKPKKVTEPTQKNQNQTTQQIKPSEEKAKTPEHGEYTAQLLSLKDKNKIDEIRKKLNSSAYYTEIQETEINGETWYRLRLAGSFSKPYAEYLAKKIQSEFKEITDYWVTKR